MNNLIVTTEQQGVFTITLNRTHKKNALNEQMYRDLCKYFQYAQNTQHIHCLVIRGDENCFCAGNDLKDFLQSSDKEDLIALDFIKILANFNKPLVAAVAGVAVGIGTTLLLHCDMVIAAKNAKFKLPFAQLGLCPEAGSSLLLSRLIGQNLAFELMVLGKGFDVQKAYQYGLVNEVCQPDELLNMTAKIAETIAALPSDAVITSKRLIRQSTQANLTQAMKDEATEFSRLIKTPECKNILAQFFQT